MMRPRKVLPDPNKRLMELLREEIIPDGYASGTEAKEFFKEACWTVATYPMELQESLIPLLENDPNRDHYIFLAGAIEDDLSPIILNEYVAYHESLGAKRANLFLLGALRCYSQLPQLDDYSTASDETRRVVKALFTVTVRLQNEANKKSANDYRNHVLPVKTVTPPRIAHGLRNATVVTGDDLVQLIVDNPGEAKQIAEIIIERDTSDVDYIKSIINSETRAISEGNL